MSRRDLVAKIAADPATALRRKQLAAVVAAHDATLMRIHAALKQAPRGLLVSPTESGWRVDLDERVSKRCLLGGVKGADPVAAIERAAAIVRVETVDVRTARRYRRWRR